MGISDMLGLGRKRSSGSIDERMTQVLSGESPEVSDIPRDYVKDMMTGFLYYGDLDSLKLLRGAFPLYSPDDQAIDEIYESCKVTGDHDLAKRVYELTQRDPPESTHEREYQGTLDIVLEDGGRKATLKEEQSDLSDYLTKAREVKSSRDFLAPIMLRHPFIPNQDNDISVNIRKKIAISDYLRNVEVEKFPAHLRISIYSVTDILGRDWVSAPYEEVEIDYRR